MKKTFVMFLIALTLLCSFNVCAQGTVDKIGVKNELILFDESDFMKVFGKSLSMIRVSSLPKSAVGALELKGLPLSENSEISSANIKKMTFRPARNFSGTTAFFWQGAGLNGAISPDKNLVRILITNQQTISVPNVKTIPNNVYPETIEVAPRAEPTIKPKIEPTIAPTIKPTLAPSTGTQAPRKAEVTKPPVVRPTAEPVPTAAPAPAKVMEPPLFADMNKHWAEYSAGKLYALNIVKGEQVGNLKYFYPDTKISRINFIIMILAAKGIKFDNYDVSKPIFADESKYQLWIVKPAHAAYDYGISSGALIDGALYINPYATVTRLEAIYMISSAFATPPSVLKIPPFADMNTVPDWGYDAVAKLYSYGFIKGSSSGMLRPYDEITKAEAAEMVYQLIKGDNMLRSIK